MSLLLYKIDKVDLSDELLDHFFILYLKMDNSFFIMVSGGVFKYFELGFRVEEIFLRASGLNSG